MAEARVPSCSYISHSSMMQGFTFLLLVASVALLGTVIPVQTTFVGKRETNGERFARDLPPLPPPRRSPTDSA